MNMHFNGVSAVKNYSLQTSQYPNIMSSFPPDQSTFTQKQLTSLKQIFTYISGDSQQIQTETLKSLTKLITLNKSIQNIVIRTIKLLLSQRPDFLIFDYQQRGLDITASLFESCDYSSIILIQIYVLPIITKLSCDFAAVENKKQFKKNKQKNQQQYMNERLSVRCIELLIIWAGVKQKRLYECEQTGESSLFLDALIKFMDTIPNNQQFLMGTRSEQEICLKYGISYKEVDKKIKLLRKKYLSKLLIFQEEDNSEIKNFSDYAMNKFLNSIKNQKCQQHSSIIFEKKKNNVQETIIAFSEEFIEESMENIPELDYKCLYKTLDTFLTSPLIRLIFDVLGNSINFQQKRVCISILSELVKWGDIEAYLVTTYSDVIENIANRISEVRGDKSLAEGQKIFPEIPNKEGKGKFYIQFLRFLQIFELCIEQDLEGQMQTPKISLLYENLKKNKKFIFPENLMLKRIQKQFVEGMKQNLQRNSLILNMIKQNPSSMLNFHASSFSTSKVQSRVKTQFLKRVQRAQEQLQNIMYSQDSQKIKSAINELIIFQEYYENQLAQIEEEAQIDNKEAYDNIIQGQRIVYVFDSIRNSCEEFVVMTMNLNEFKAKIKQVIDNIKFENLQESFSVRNLSKSSISDQNFVDLNNSFVTVNELFGKENKKVNANNSTHNKSLNYIECFQIKNQQVHSEKDKDDDNFSVKSIDYNEVVKMQNPKFKMLDHSASYSSIGTRHNLSFGLKHKKNISDRIQNILRNMKRLCASNRSKHFSTIKSINKDSESAFLKSTLNNNEESFINCLQEPSIFSHYSNEEEKNQKIMSFKECLSLEKQIIKENIFQKTYLKKERQFESQWTIKRQKSESTCENKEQQSCRSQPTVVLVKNTYENDHILSKGRLINTNIYESLFKKLPKYCDKSSLLKNKIKIYKDKFIDLRIMVNLLGNQLHFELYLIPNHEIKNIKLMEYNPLMGFETIKVNIINYEYDKFSAGSQYMIKGIASFLNFQQSDFPKLQLLYTYKTVQKKLVFQIPLNIHHFTKYSPLGAKSSLRADRKQNILRTDKFVPSKEFNKIYQLERVIEGLKLLKQKKNERLLGVQGSLPFTNAKFQIYIKIIDDEFQIFSVLDFKKTEPVQSLISTIRYALEYNY